MKKIGKYVYEKSTLKNKKLMTKVDGKTIHFGNPQYEHYRDKTGIWKELDHNDEKRRKNYLSRSGGIKDKSGKLTKDDPSSPNYHARLILW
jgi:hypothetical protein